jgi:hypothetical protein
MIRFSVALFAFLGMALACATGQTSSIASCGDYPVRAGEVLKVKVALDKAPGVVGANLQVAAFSPGENYTQIFGHVWTLQGVSQYEIPLEVPVTAVGGVWTLKYIRIFIQGREPYEVPFTPCTFQVIAYIDPTLPTKAAISINPSQTQFLRKEAVRIQSQVQQIKSQFQELAASNQIGSVHTLLRMNLLAAEASLTTTQLQFLALGNNQNQKPHANIFFDDLERGYSTAISQLNSSSAFASPHGPHLMRVSNSAPTPDAMLALTLIPLERTELAFSTVADTSSLVFDLVVETTPPGAAVSYYREGDSPQPISEVTRATIHSLAYARWRIRVELPGYTTVVTEHNPFVEPNHVVHVDLKKPPGPGK